MAATDPTPPAAPPPASPKTTLAGLAAAIGLALLAAGDYFSIDALKAIGGVLAAVGAGATGILARDSK